MRFILVLVVFFLFLSFAQAASPVWNWNGPYQPCKRHNDLLSHDRLDLGVRISTANRALAEQFENALNFWSGVLDMTWHEVSSRNCSVQVVDGMPELFVLNEAVAARSQLPGRPGFEGWIAFNPAVSSTPEEMFRDAVHEIGHLFGLPHNPSLSSVMFFDNFGQDSLLDLADLRALAGMHKLRPAVLEAIKGLELTGREQEPSALPRTGGQ